MDPATPKPRVGIVTFLFLPLKHTVTCLFHAGCDYMTRGDLVVPVATACIFIGKPPSRQKTVTIHYF